VSYLPQIWSLPPSFILKAGQGISILIMPKIQHDAKKEAMLKKDNIFNIISRCIRFKTGP
jgi:hypothetical protein